jgi:hypothetical protein
MSPTIVTSSYRAPRKKRRQPAPAFATVTMRMKPGRFGEAPDLIDHAPAPR